MVNFASLLKSSLVAIVLSVATGHADEKLATCCERVNKNEITEPILGYLSQPARYPCVNAIIFQTRTGLFCSPVNAPWVSRKIKELRRTKALSKTPSVVTSSPSPVSLLSIITSTASPLSPSNLPPSSSSPFFTSISTMTSGDTFSGNEEEESSMSSGTMW
ncbi:hypothetical protein AMECASPLE_031010 [Ameca splendens]|uniref:Chemokine interleukin-8-like domain-containing protein n=1 Tax=Ameca splendens TaxID=208324 RepID=A0ABV1A454_9TELE